MISVTQQLGSLRSAATSGDLERLCQRHDVDLLLLFGSALDSETPGDIDLALAFRPRTPSNLLTFLSALAALVPGDHIDLLDLDRAGPVAKQRALTRCEVLYATTPAAFYERQIFAINQYIETRPLRDAILQKLAS